MVVLENLHNIFIFYFFCGRTCHLLGWTISNHKKVLLKTRNSKLRNLVSGVVPAKVSKMSFQKKNVWCGTRNWKLILEMVKNMLKASSCWTFSIVFFTWHLHAAFSKCSSQLGEAVDNLVFTTIFDHQWFCAFDDQRWWCFCRFEHLKNSVLASSARVRAVYVWHAQHAPSILSNN